MGKRIDQTGNKHGKLTVLEYVGNNKYKQALWRCKCDCGKEVIVIGTELRNGKVQSCGCLKKEVNHKMRFIDETGKRYGRLTVLKQAPNRIRNKIAWQCQCDCGNKIIVLGDLLRNGSTKSCGCLKSLGQTKIQQILFQNNIYFEREKTFDSCRLPDTNQLARFDFYVNNQYLIEYDGIQHFEYKQGGWRTKEKLQITQKSDNYKNQWCKQNNISLIRIPYTHINNLVLQDLLIETSNFII